MIIPAIDLLDGDVVRLTHGDFNKKTVYPLTPFELVNDYSEAGAKRIHIVDLDGAKAPENRQWDIISALIHETPVEIQVGGGFRSMVDIKRAIDIGATSVLVSSLFTDSPDQAKEVLQAFPNQVIFAADVKYVEGTAYLATHGWTKISERPAFDIIAEFVDQGLTSVLSTDISRDGAKQGPNLQLYKDLARTFSNLHIIASGGVTTLDDIRQVTASGAQSMVIGKALFDGDINLSEALKC